MAFNPRIFPGRIAELPESTPGKLFLLSCIGRHLAYTSADAILTPDDWNKYSSWAEEFAQLYERHAE